MDTSSSVSNTLVLDALNDILKSRHFQHAQTLRRFLHYIVTETLEGRGERIHGHSIAVDVFDKSNDFDTTRNSLVRRNAVRLRIALQNYYDEVGEDLPVVIKLPTPGYRPIFEFKVAPLLPSTEDKTTEIISIADPDIEVVKISNLSADIVDPSSLEDDFDTKTKVDVIEITEPEIVSTPKLESKLGRRNPSRLLLIAASLLLAIFALGIFSVFWENDGHPAQTDVVIYVMPTRKGDTVDSTVASRLTAHLSSIGLSRVIQVDDGIQKHKFSNQAVNFKLVTNLSGNKTPRLSWQLINPKTEAVLASSVEWLPESNSSAIDLSTQNIALKLLGIRGEIPAIVSRPLDLPISGQICLARSPFLEVVKNNVSFVQLRDCIEEMVARSPANAEAWAVLSKLYTLRSYQFDAGTEEERAAMVKKAENAAQQAAVYAPGAYLTKVALLNLAHRQGRLDEYIELQRDFRKRYPGDVFMQVRIATRIARMGRGHGREALQIFDKIRTEYDFDLKNWAPGIAIAHYSEGEYEQAWRQLQRSTSNLPFVHVMKIAVLGKLGRADEATSEIETIFKMNPDIKTNFYSWLTGVSWDSSLVLDVADGLDKASLKVDIPS